MLLERLGMDVRIAYDGAAALALVSTFKPHFAFIDIGMPGMDGYETARRIRMLPEVRRRIVDAPWKQGSTVILSNPSELKFWKTCWRPLSHAARRVRHFSKLPASVRSWLEAGSGGTGNFDPRRTFSRGSGRARVKSRLCVGRQGLRLEAEGGKAYALKPRVTRSHRRISVGTDGERRYNANQI
jgi:hypothetical protein